MTQAQACAALAAANNGGTGWKLAQHYGNDGKTILYTIFEQNDPLPTGYTAVSCPPA